MPANASRPQDTLAHSRPEQDTTPDTSPYAMPDTTTTSPCPLVRDFAYEALSPLHHGQSPGPDDDALLDPDAKERAVQRAQRAYATWLSMSNAPSEERRARRGRIVSVFSRLSRASWAGGRVR